MTELEIPDSILETFRCSFCKRYLSCAPVQILADGNSICSVCSRSAEQPTFREITFEALLSKLSFPCQFKQYGCEERFSFGRGNEHENSCTYRSFLCPVVPKGSCSWEGLGTQISNHFTKQHADLTKEKAEFKLWVEKDEQRILLFAFDGVCLILQCMYHADTSNFQYDVRYLTGNVEKALCTIRLTNDNDHNCNVNLKAGACLPYNHSFYEMQYSKSLVLNNYLQLLDNPKCIAVAINVSLTKSVGKNPPTEQLIVNHDLLQSLRCNRCRGYLIPPLFNSPNGVVCCYCDEKFGNTKALHAEELKEIVANANFPCCWPDCAFIGKAENLKKHHSSCPQRVFKCISCKISFTRNRAMSHLRYHGYTYFTDWFVYKMVFKKHYPKKKMFTFKDNEIVVIKQETISSSTQFDRHILGMHVIGSYSSDVNAKVEFSHNHCKTKSETFVFNTYNPCYCFMINDLPLCFKAGEKLRVTVRV